VQKYSGKIEREREREGEREGVCVRVVPVASKAVRARPC